MFLIFLSSTFVLKAADLLPTPYSIFIRVCFP
ncbi:hypothetical protein GLYMA_06G213125v4 [Glycine max]|nr:hypothetical protein GLYMA_06G213125v4 [Glycine max]KAH1126963.1 hypothetical protein GYH30_015796 [Glycine max]